MISRSGYYWLQLPCLAFLSIQILFASEPLGWLPGCYDTDGSWMVCQKSVYCCIVDRDPWTTCYVLRSTTLLPVRGSRSMDLPPCLRIHILTLGARLSWTVCMSASWTATIGLPLEAR